MIVAAPALNGLIPLTIEKPAAGGRMIARVDGRIVLVSGAIPGERVVARVERIGKGVVYAETTTIEVRSPDRRDASSDPLCGGCLYNHIAYPRQLEIKSQVLADAFARIGHLELPDAIQVRASREDGYRMRARLHVRGGRVGFFREATHDLCDAAATRQLLPDAVAAVERAARVAGVEKAEIELSENVPGTERAIAIDGRVHTGADCVHDTLTIDGHRVSLRRHVLAFSQGNRYLLEALVNHVVARVRPAATIVDLYAGAGLFSVPMGIATGAQVTAVEGDRYAAADLAWNAGSAEGAHVRAEHRPVEDFATHTRIKPNALVVDPPRTGMSRVALDGVLRLGPARIVYVSCDVATLARDARRLVDAGYTIAHADAFDMFPNTPHVETVVVFER